MSGVAQCGKNYTGHMSHCAVGIHGWHTLCQRCHFVLRTHAVRLLQIGYVDRMSDFFYNLRQSRGGTDPRVLADSPPGSSKHDRVIFGI
jgi:hypothetical protein